MDLTVISMLFMIKWDTKFNFTKFASIKYSGLSDNIYEKIVIETILNPLLKA